MMYIKRCFILFKLFFRLGLFTIGGGYVILPMLQRELVERLKWIDEKQLLNIYAIGQSTPGIIAINTATFIGYQRAGALGGISATLGMVSPSLIIIMIIAAFFRHFKDYPIVQGAFVGIRVAVAMLLLITVVRMFKKGVTDTFGCFLCAGAFLALTLFNISAIWIVTASGLLGIVYYRRKEQGE